MITSKEWTEFEAKDSEYTVHVNKYGTVEFSHRGPLQMSVSYYDWNAFVELVDEVSAWRARRKVAEK